MFVIAATAGLCFRKLSGAECQAEDTLARYEEMIGDAHAEHGHLDLIIRQRKPMGLTAEDIWRLSRFRAHRRCSTRGNG